MRKEAAILAIISLVLTIVNTMCILVTAVLVLKVAREQYKTHQPSRASILKEWEKVSRDVKRLVSKEDDSKDMADEHEITSENQLRNLQTYYTQQTIKKNKPPHVKTIFPEPVPEPKPEPKPETKPKKSVREFRVVETENPHHTSIVRVQQYTEKSDTYSVKTECGV